MNTIYSNHSFVTALKQCLKRNSEKSDKDIICICNSYLGICNCLSHYYRLYGFIYS